MKRILVTGGAGLVGSHLCKALIDRGDEVICIDNLSTGDANNIYSLFSNLKFTLICRDICEDIWGDTNMSGDIDEIYNLACPASPKHYQADPLKTMWTNIYGAKNILELAKTKGSKILQASTSEVYGDPREHPQTESYWGNVNPIGVRSCYDEGKRCAESLFTDYKRQHGVNIRIARIFNTYGSHMSVNDGRVISNFIVQALRNKLITVYGDGNHTRSFCHVSDTVDGLMKLMDCDNDFHQPVNIGNPDEFTIISLATKVVAMTNSKSVLYFESLPEDDPKQRKPNIELAKKLLGWEPKVSIDDGLTETIEYFKKRL